MNATTQNQPRTEPGSHNPDFHSGNPLSDWARANKGFLGLVVVALAAGFLLNTWLPKQALAAKQSSWALYQSVLSTEGGAFGAEQLPGTLARVSEDSRVQGWVVLAGIQDAINRDDRVALQILVEEGSRIQDSGGLSGVIINTPDGAKGIMENALSRASSILAGSDAINWDNPAPKGPKVKFTLTVNEETTYDFVVGLYPEVAPNACEAFLLSVRDGSLTQRIGVRSGAFAWTIKPESSFEDSEGLAPETKWGYYHSKGSLAFSQKSGDANMCNSGSVEIFLQNAYHLDGRTTVFGMILEGADALDQLQYGGPSQQDDIQSMRLTAAEILN